MRFIVCGGADYGMPKKGSGKNLNWEPEYDTVYDALSTLRDLGFTDMIYGAAPSGVDLVASGIWSEFIRQDREKPVPKELSLCAVPDFEWSEEEKEESSRTDLIDRFSPDLLLAFPGDRRTADMIDQARQAGISVMPVATKKVGKGIRGIRK